MMRAHAIAVAALVLAGLAAGCASGPGAAGDAGYAVRNRYPKEDRTVAVNVFRNDTYDRALNGQLTEAIIKEVQAMTPYRIASEARADTLLRGTVRRRAVRELSKSLSTGLTEEALYEVEIDWEWVDQRTGKVIVARNAFTASALFVPSRPSAEPTEIGRFAVVQNLASDVVANMQATW